MFPLNEIHDKYSGFLVNGELKIVAKIKVLQVIVSLDSNKGKINNNRYYGCYWVFNFFRHMLILQTFDCVNITISATRDNIMF